METSETLARDFLLENAPHIQLLTWGGNVTNKSSFLDTRTATGYDHGYRKLWDCGQTKFVKEIK